MTDKEKLNAIRAEIHRLVDVRGYDRGMAIDLFAFMDSLPDGPVSEDLKEAARKAGQKYFHDEENIWARPNYEAKKAECAFKEGANWGRNQAKVEIQAQSMSLPHGCPKEKPISEELEEASKKYSSCIYLEEVLSDDDKEVLKERLVNTFKAGAQWQKEQMMKDAVYGLVCGHDESSPAWIDLNLLNKPNVKVGTEVKLIIIKDE